MSEDNKKAVCVYCGSSSRVDDVFKQEAAAVGKMLAENGWQVVYGGGNVGLMGIVADEAMKAGGEVVGIIPAFLEEREVQHEQLTELHVVDSMHTRKQMMVDRSDAFLVLPGGFGTMDEFFEVLTWRQLGIHNSPLVVYNVKEYWNGLPQLMSNIAKEGFARDEDLSLVAFTDNREDIVGLLETQREDSGDLSTKWI